METIGRYRVLGVVGEGAAGVVHRATDGEREVAVKVLRSADPVAQRRFAREASLVRDSPHLVPVLETGAGWFAMPLYATSLAARLREGPLPLDETVSLAAEIARGLDALHAQGVVHRDVKPSNVLLDGDGVAALADFGLVRGEGDTQLTHDGQLVGTAHYLAPELIDGQAVTPASDVYALGCLLYECVAGEPPFAGRRETELGFAHLVEPPPDPRARRPELSADLALALLSALEKDARSRPTTASALARMLHLAHTASRARSRA